MSDAQTPPATGPVRPEIHPALGREVVYWPASHEDEPKGTKRALALARVVHVYPEVKDQPPTVDLLVFTRGGIVAVQAALRGDKPGEWTDT